MTQQQRTMEQLSYGIERPSDLLAKLRWDADKLTESPHPYDVFNFVLTAAVLAEWIQKFYSSDSAPEPFSAPNKERKVWLLPSMSPLWIGDTSCELSASWSHFVSGIKEPVDSRHKGATLFPA